MENIPYYNFSTFPVSNDVLLQRINTAVVNGYKMIFIDFGGYFPWSSDNIIRSDFAYSDKLIDRVVKTCAQNDIILVPVFSILFDSDFITSDSKYKSLVGDGLGHNGLDVSSCGVSKLVEELIDDIYSLLFYSDYLLIELPSPKILDGTWSKATKSFIVRLIENFNCINKKLILGYNSNFEDGHGIEIYDDFKCLYKVPEAKTKIYNSNSFSLELFTDIIKLSENEYRLFRINGSEGLSCGLDAGDFAFNYRNLDTATNIGKINLDQIESFFENLYEAWVLIRECGEVLTLIYRNTDLKYRIKYCRSVLYLNKIYASLKIKSDLMLDLLEKEYQPGKFRQWINTKIDSVYKQLNSYDLIAAYMKEGDMK